MKEQRRAEAIQQLAFVIYAQAGIFNEINLFRILSIQGGGDLRVRADRVLTDCIYGSCE